jgi:hypothetical protein
MTHFPPRPWAEDSDLLSGVLLVSLSGLPAGDPAAMDEWEFLVWLDRARPEALEAFAAPPPASTAPALIATGVLAFGSAVGLITQSWPLYLLALPAIGCFLSTRLPEP